MSTTYSGIDILEVMDDAVVYNNHIVSQLQKFNRGNEALDFGAGRGLFAKKLAERNVQVTCVEADRQLAANLSKEFSTYASLQESARNFQFVYSINVLEHIEDDQLIANELKARLQEGGRVFIYVPAFMVLYSSLDKKIGHHRRYTKETLVPLFADLNIIHCRYVDSLGFFAALLYKCIGSKEGRVSPLALKFFDRIVFPLSLVLDTVTHPFFGKNLLLIAEKPGA